MIEQLFGSKTRVKLLGLFYQNPNRSFYVREITRKIDEQINSVRRELANLLSIGIIKSDSANNKLYYEVNPEFEHHDALSAIFGNKSAKSVKEEPDAMQEGMDSPSQQNDELEYLSDDNGIKLLLKSGNVRAIIYSGQFTREDKIGADIILIGDINIPNLEHAISEIEKDEKKELRYTVFSPEEFSYRKQINDRFVANLILAKKIVHLDRDNHIE